MKEGRSFMRYTKLQKLAIELRKALKMANGNDRVITDDELVILRRHADQIEDSDPYNGHRTRAIADSYVSLMHGVETVETMARVILDSIDDAPIGNGI
jgi:hypothetical protein